MPGLPFLSKKGRSNGKPNDNKRVYTFIQGESDGDITMKQLLGGKGAGLCDMARIGLNVPPGFVISTEVCQEYYQSGGKLPESVWEEVLQALKEVETAHGKRFGDANDPLLVSVRSGAALSMPGMMNTVLNIGLNEDNLPGLARHHGERFAYDCYRRLLDMYGDVVLDIDHALFEHEISAVKKDHGYKYDVELKAEDLKEVCERYKALFTLVEKVMPTDPYEQLKWAINAVFNSWETPRAVKYREINKITGLKGTAVNVQTMVYGNTGPESGSGVAFTRNPATGEPGIFGEFLANAQGEDVVAGIRTPLPVAEMADQFPQAYKDLVENCKTLEKHFKDMQDLEFTIQDGVLFMLQTRNGKRTGPAAVRVAVDFVSEGRVSKEEAILMVEPRHLDQLLHPMFSNVNSPDYKNNVLTKGLPASPGAGCGRVVFSAEDAEAWNARGEQVVLVRTETSPEDVGGMHAAQAVLTSRGGMTSHAAVVARGWGKPCVCGANEVQVDYNTKTAHIHDVSLNEGDWISINGTTGEVVNGKQATRPPETQSGLLGQFMTWVDTSRRMGVMTNCDTPEDAIIARKNGAQGIGLVRSEHQFFSSSERIAAVRRMIAAEELEMADAEDALKELEQYQRTDFIGIFEAMDGLPVTIRCLDPPLAEFMDLDSSVSVDKLVETISREYKAKSSAGMHMAAPKVLRSKLAGLKEINPMMGLRGCRLGIVHSGITRMQASAIIDAAIDCAKRGIVVKPHIMIPLVGFEEELENQKAIVQAAAEEVFARNGGTRVEYKVGTMIEVPRGALRAGDLAKHAEFFSVGSNDLTQMTLGFSRDDAEAKFIHQYLQKGILTADPFETLDQSGVGELIRIAKERGKATRPDISIGICGEHGGDPKSIEFCESVGLDYVSCSPLRVPIARLAAAQAAIKAKQSSSNDHCQD